MRANSYVHHFNHDVNLTFCTEKFLMLTVKNADIAVIWMKGNYTCLVSSINDPVLSKLRSFVVPLSTKYVLLSNKLHEFEDQCEAKQSTK